MSDFKKSRLIALVKKFSPEDLRSMARFLESPYHNSNGRLPGFFRLIRNHYPDFNNKNFTAEKIHTKLYQDRDFNAGIFQGLKADLTRKIQSFLAFEEVKQDQQLKDSLTCKGHGRRDGYHTFIEEAESRIKKIKKKGDKLNLQDVQHLLNTYHSLFFHAQTNQESDIASNYINNGMSYLDCFYFFSKLIYGAELLSQSKIKKQHYEIKLLDNAIKLGKQTALNDNILFNLYVLAVELLKSEKEVTYNKLKSHLFQNADNIPVEGKMMGIVVLVNFAIARLNKGNPLYQQELFELYKFRDHANLFLKEENISAHTFTNVVISAAACGDFSWANYFITKYTPFVDKVLREDTLNLSNAFIHFHKQSYDDVLRSLITIKNKSFNTSIRTRSLYIRTYYELSLNEAPYTELAINELNKLSTYLRKNKTSKVKEEAYLNFRRICIAILNGRPKADLQQMMDNMKPLKFRIWLQEKVKAL